MEIFNSILDNVNTIICSIVGFTFLFQIIYLFLFWLPKRKYPQAKEKHKVGIIIPAKDESSVIERILKNLSQINYPKDKYEIIVLADNCTDNTAKLARNFESDVSIRVFERQESNKKKCNVGWALNFLFKQINCKDYEFFIRFDADAIVDKEYLNKMNDAYESGALAAKGYNHASNLTQNTIAGVSGLWYIRDGRFNCHARAALSTDVILVGSGMMFASKIIKEDNGWHATGASEDTEFTIQNLKKKRKIRYVPDAIVYDDQPSAVNDLFKRNIRMGHSLHKLFWKEGLLCLFKFFTTFRYCFLDMFLNLLFIPIAVLCCVWFPLYYGYNLLFNYLSPLGDVAVANSNLIFIVIILFCAFLIPFIAQAFLVYFLDRKKIKQPFKKMFWSLIAFPIFMIIYAIGIVIGVFSKQKWKKAKRNTEYIDVQQT